MSWIAKLKRRRVYLPLVGLALLSGYIYFTYRMQQPMLSPAVMQQKRAAADAQNESAVSRPLQTEVQRQDADGTQNVFFGDLHVHTRLSFDSYIFGNGLSLDQAYRFAKGEALHNPAGEEMRLDRPLDFAAITDHAEGFGLHEGCARSDNTPADNAFCRRFQQPDMGFFMELRKTGQERPMRRPTSWSAEQIDDLAGSTWRHIVDMAERHNEPGRFTSFAAYEYSPPLPERGKIHRNVIFRNAHVPQRAVSGYDAATEIDLWQSLATTCEAPCDVLAIPHNPNRTWGLAFAGVTLDGDLYTPRDWQQRRRFEPLVEMFQIKGNSECAFGLTTQDEMCRFEQFLPVCPDGAELGKTGNCIHQTSMARDGLKQGLMLAQELGFNPLQFGMIGSTDTHNSNPGDTEEWDFRGSSGGFTAPAVARIRGRTRPLEQNPGGLAAVWATENSRDALFAAMRRREVYATSGTRPRLRVFGSFTDLTPALNEASPISFLERQGVPMGGYLAAQPDSTPQFFVWALRDPLAAPLDRVQIVKAWLENGEVRESIVDVVCSDGRTAQSVSGACPALDIATDTTDCRAPSGQGARELKAIWRDPAYRADQPAFYYVRLIEVPSCRWSSFDAIRLRQEPPSRVPALISEMAWSSPIWIGGPAPE